MRFVRPSLTARLLMGASALLMAAQFLAILVDGDYRSVQGAGGLWGIPRWLAPLSLAAGVLAVIPLFRYLEHRLLPRLAWARWASPLLVLVSIIALFYGTAEHPMVGAMNATLFWVGLAMCVQVVNLNKFLGGHRLIRLAASVATLASLLLVWLVHYGIFDASRDDWRSRLAEAESALEISEFGEALATAAAIAADSPIPSVGTDAAALGLVVRGARRDAALAAARGHLDASGFDKAREVLVVFLGIEDRRDYRVAAEAMLVEVGERLGDRYLREAAAAEQRGAWDEALDTTRQMLEETPQHSRLEEAVSHEARREREAARACQARVEEALDLDQPEYALDLTRKAPGRYPDALADTNLPRLRTVAADVLVRLELEEAAELEEKELYNDALETLRAIRSDYPESSLLAEPDAQVTEIRSLARDSAAIWSRSYFIRERSPFSIFGKSPEWLMTHIEDLKMHDPTKAKLEGDLLINCRDVYLEDSHLYRACYQSWKGRLFEIYVRFGEDIDMNGIVQTTIKRYGSRYSRARAKGKVVYSWHTNAGDFNISPDRRLMVIYNRALSAKYKREKNR
jgi:tetratricopeptide (TPR) repeat protein